MNDVNERLGNTLGNLTFSGGNSELGNKSILEKRSNRRGGYDFSGFPLNSYFKDNNITTWDETTIITRAQYLMGIAVKLWPLPPIKNGANISQINPF